MQCIGTDPVAVQLENRGLGVKNLILTARALIIVMYEQNIHRPSRAVTADRFEVTATVLPAAFTS